MRCWGELKSLRGESDCVVSAYKPCLQFSGYVEMKVSQAYNCRKAGYAPDVRSVSCLNVEKYFDYLKQMHYQF